MYQANYIKDYMRRPFYEENDIKQRWKTYFEKLMREENKRKDQTVTKASKKKVEKITTSFRQKRTYKNVATTEELT